MRVISNKALVDFSSEHPEASQQLQAWRRTVECRSFSNFAELKMTFNAVNKVDPFHVFDIGGNKYRIVAAINFAKQKVFIRQVFTHKEYDKWKP